MSADVPTVVIDKPLSQKILNQAQNIAAKLDELSFPDHLTVMKILGALMEGRAQHEQEKKQQEMAEKAQAAARERAFAINQPTVVRG